VLNHKKIKIILSIIIFIKLSCANAEISGNSLSEYCNEQIKILNNNGYTTSNQTDMQLSRANFCAGYVAAISDTYGSFICVPETVTYSQAIKITAKYLNDHPEKLNIPADLLIYAALRDAFPCPKKTR
jgi:hypothetical protein